MALVKASIEAHDQKRVIQYGEAVVAEGSGDTALLDRIARAYLESDDKASATKGLDYAKRYEAALEKLRKQAPPGRTSTGQWFEELDKAMARAYVTEARANGNLGDTKAAIELAKKSYELYPSAEGAREWGKWLAATGAVPEALEHYADAFMVDDPRSTEADRLKDRRKLGELYTKANGSEKGMGELVLRAYDRTSSLQADRTARLKSADPNALATSVLDFKLPGVNGHDLALASLKGKTIVMDFWATWCGPCKAQRPLYEEVEKRFQGQPDVVFLSVNTDEDRTLVPPFVEKQKWTNTVYFDGGLSDYLKVNSIPTTLIVDKTGQVSSRMNGFIPERFVDLLSERIRETLR